MIRRLLGAPGRMARKLAGAVTGGGRDRPAPARRWAEQASAPAPAPKAPRTVKVETTPNARARKFVLPEQLSDQPLSFDKPGEHPISRALFTLAAVESLFIVEDFVVVTLRAKGSWEQAQPEIIDLLGAT